MPVEQSMGHHPGIIEHYFDYDRSITLTVQCNASSTATLAMAATTITIAPSRQPFALCTHHHTSHRILAY